MDYTTSEIVDSYPWACRFARSCASKLPSHFDRGDLQSAGIEGYLRAAGRYNNIKGASFRGYCATRIRGAILDELRRTAWAPRSVRESQHRLASATYTLIEKLKREPTTAELAKTLDISVSDLGHLQELAKPRPLISLDEVEEAGEGEEYLSLAETIPDPATVSPDVAALSAENRRTLCNCITKLPRTEACVIVLYYLQGMPFQDIAQKLKVTPSRVSQWHHQALVRLKRSWKIAES